MVTRATQTGRADTQKESPVYLEATTNPTTTNPTEAPVAITYIAFGRSFTYLYAAEMFGRQEAKALGLSSFTIFQQAGDALGTLGLYFA